MQKLTKRQREIEALVTALPKPTKAFRKWHERLVAKEGWADSVEVWEMFYTAIGKYVVERTFDVGKDHCDEVAQTWIDTENGKVYYREKHSKMIYGGYYGHRWLGYDTSTPFIYKHKCGMRDQYGYRFCLPYQYGEIPITKVLERKGATAEDVKEFGIERLSTALADSRWETILKHSLKDFYWLMKNGRELTEPVWSAYKITIRHHYHIRNIELWYDLIREMAFLGMDVRNPKFVCSKAYKRLHDDVVRRADHKRAMERKKAQEEYAREQNERRRELVEERTNKFGDLSISNGDLHSVVLITYDDYHDEGSAMHHCVGGYFDQSKSLILSMRDNEGKRVETVEVSLNTFDIVQSRGVCNKSTSHHNEIMELVNSNMWQIRQRMTA